MENTMSRTVQDNPSFTDCARPSKAVLYGIITELAKLSGDALIKRVKEYKKTICVIKSLVSSLAKAQRIEMIELQQKKPKEQEVIADLKRYADKIPLSAEAKL